MTYKTYIEKALSKNVKTCTKCGLDTNCPIEELRPVFSGRNSRCNSCTANNYVTCGCGRDKHKRILESQMKIYAVRIDTFNKGVGTYFYEQRCLTGIR